VDKIFGKGTGPGEVASYLVHALAPATQPVLTGAAAGDR
jgi:beta-lysine 5,6-aminomutase beta subunit